MEANKKKMSFYSPLRYPGGKNGLYLFVSNLINENKYLGKSYAEPYAGGCGLALKLLFEGVVNEIYLNDFDNSIYSFWNSILNQADEFCNWIESLEITVDNWHYYKNILNDAHNHNPFEIAQATFFLNRTNVSGVIKGGVIGGQNQNGKYKINARFNKSKLVEKIRLIYEKRSNIHFFNLDAIDFLNHIKSLDSIFIYLDPPYHLKGSELYLNFYKNNDHVKLFDYLNNLDLDFILSYDNSQFIKDTYNKFKTYSFNISQSTSNKIGEEIIIFSDNLKYKKSIKMLNSAKKIRQKKLPKQNIVLANGILNEN
ncbi:DNA adenine methylase [Chryseobacterium sp. SORGH_AS 447]|uniref:DNA adenine methylase n=1 Tax=Chryseobacterium sp. SORGH_AS_0447 TaxID=3041769 RepID=UPI0027869D11|nr:DNA adenine methylase [Chryseobacterium sp. SORGH_AS_0447]MDQ1163443.1 DNA adenine methylase [Chryseobacterium sp. SORGH_AS_0447]